MQEEISIQAERQRLYCERCDKETVIEDVRKVIFEDGIIHYFCRTCLNRLLI